MIFNGQPFLIQRRPGGAGGICAIACTCFTTCLQEVSAEADDKAAWSRRIQPVLEQYCYDCHAEGVKKGGVSLDSHRDLESLMADRNLWKRIRDQIDFRLMPPPDEDLPSDQERDELIRWIDETVFPVDAANPDPGHVTLRRLNRTEYQNTLRDLLEVEPDVADILPPDDAGYGFDNIGDVLSLSPAHLERYLDAAEAVLDRAIRIGPMPRTSQAAGGDKLRGDGRAAPGVYHLHSNGEARARFDVPRSGRYRVEITAGGTPGGDADPQMELRINGRTRHAWSVAARPDKPAVHAREVVIRKAGQATVAAVFTNDFYDETAEDPARADRNLLVSRITLVGPLDGPPPPKPATHRRIFDESAGVKQVSERATRILKPFLRRAFRRNPTPHELQRYRDLALEHADGDLERGIRDAMLAILVAPSFIFREEAPVATDASATGKALIHEFALASRLSYFLWSTMPDDRLLELAQAGKLRANLHGELRRMLASEKSAGLVEDFAGQWLQIRDIDVIAPDLKVFPEFNRGLANDMRRETELLFQHVLRENLPLRTLIDADFTFLNERLADHYGIPGIRGPEFRKVSLKGTPRRGILGHASILTLTSYPTRTSPVIRGKYILHNILNTPPPPPPQNVPPLEAGHEKGEQLPLRRQLERHRADPSCASCHALIDPPGFGLENFDAIGRWREMENGHPIDPSGKLADGRTFAGPDGLLEHLRDDPQDRYLRAAASKMLTYALGRGLEFYDRPAVDAIVKRTKDDGGRMQTMILAIVESVPFQYRRARSTSSKP